jgi:hypothetical protein
MASVGGNVIQVGVTEAWATFRVNNIAWMPFDVSVEAGIGITVTLEPIVRAEDGVTEGGVTKSGGGASSRYMPKKSMGDSKMVVSLLPVKSSLSTLVFL